MKKAFLLSFALALSTHPSKSMQPEKNPHAFKFADIKQNLYQEDSIPNIIHGLKVIEDSLKHFSVNTKMEVVYLIGDTGAGKSTLINYLMGYKMQYELDADSYQIQNANDGDHIYSPKIGNSFDSETIFPQVFSDFHNKISFVDTPGFMSTEGEMQEIMDSYAISRVLLKGQKTKISLVIEYSTVFSARGNLLIKSAEKVRQMFPQDFLGITKSTSLIITKVDLNKIKEEDLKVKLKKLIKSQNKIEQELQFLLLDIIEGDRIHLFPQPIFEIDHYAKQIKKDLCLSYSFTLRNDAKLNLSPESKLQVEKMVTKIKTFLEQSEREIFKGIKQKFEDRKFKSSEEIKAALNQVGKLQALFMDTQSLTREKLKQFFNILGFTDESTQLLFFDNLDYISYCNYLHQFIDDKQIFNRILARVKSLTQKMKNELDRFVREEEIKSIMDKHEENIQAMKENLEQAHNRKVEQLNQKIQDLIQKISQDRLNMEIYILQSQLNKLRSQLRNQMICQLF